MIFAVIFVFILFFGVIGGLTVWKIKSTDPSRMNNSTGVETTQEFLPFDEIKDYVVHLGNHQYRAYIKCSAINYNLKTEKEQDIIELSFQRFLNSLSHPISILIQTRTIDNTEMLKILKNDIDKSVESFSVLKEYGQNYYKAMKNIYNTIGNNKEKHFYIIVPFNEAILLTNSTEEEKYEYTLKEIKSRCQIIADGLQNIGLNATMLNKKEIEELVYLSTHKENASQVSNLSDFTEMTVTGSDRLSSITDEGRLDWILYEAQLRLETELYNEKAVDFNVKNQANKAINCLNELRKNLNVEIANDIKNNIKIEE